MDSFILSRQARAVTNVPLFCKHRGLVLKDTIETDDDKVEAWTIENSKGTGYIKINLDEGSLVIVCDEGTLYTDSTTKIAKLIKSLVTSKEVIHYIFLDQDAISSSALSSLKDIKLIKTYDITTLLIPIPEHVCSLGVRILRGEEKTKKIAEFEIGTGDIKKIKHTDPRCIWIGAEVGDLLSYEKMTITTGKIDDIAIVI